MTEQVNILWSDVVDGVRRQLSLLGKRTSNREGATQFPKVSITTAEEPALHDLAEEGLIRLLGNLNALWQGLTSVTGGVTFRVTNLRWPTIPGNDFISVLEPMLRSYLVSYVLGMYLLDVDSGVSTRWREDAEQRRQSVVSFLFSKEAVDLPGTYAERYSEVSGEVTDAQG